MNKKVIAVLLSLCMIFGLMPAAAQTGAVVSISNGEIFAKAGEVVELMLDLSGCGGFTDLGVEIEYDRGVMQLVYVETNPSVGLDCTTAQDLEKNPYNIGWNGTSNTNFNGTLATFRFRISPNVPEGEYVVNVDYYKGRNGDYKDGISVNYDENDNPLNLIYQPCRIFVEGDNNTSSGGGGIGGGGGTATQATLSQAEGYAGDTVDITLDIAENIGFANLGFEIEYDSSVLTLLNVKENNDVGATFTSAQYIDTIPYNLGWYSVSDVLYNGNLATLTFKIADTANAGAYPITLSYYKGRNDDYIDGASVNYDEDYNPLVICYTDGSITVNEPQEENKFRVEITSNKETYAIGEPFEVDVWLYTEDYAMKIYENEYKVSGFDNTQAGNYSVVVSYGGYSKTFEVQVLEDQEIEIVENFVVQSVAGEGVKIAPSGYNEVKDGTTMKFTVSTDVGYDVESITVNGETVMCEDGCIEVTVTQNTVVEVTGRKKTFTVSSSTNGNGQILLNTDTFEYGDKCSARIVADEGYIISDVVVDGQSVGVCKSYVFYDIKENHTISATFEKVVKMLTVKAVAEKGGKIYPARSVVNEGGSARFEITPDYGYHTAYALVNGEKTTVSQNRILLENITKDTDISVVFEKDEFLVSAIDSEGANLSVEYNGQSAEELKVPYLEDVTISIEIENGYKLNMLYVNGVSVKPEKADGKLVYNANITKETVVVARCGLTVVSEYSNEVAAAGLAADINETNAYEKREIFTALAEKYATLSASDKRACTSAYATVLAALDRANAYIALIESDIVAKIKSFPSDITQSNYRQWKEEIDNVYAQYEHLTYLSKSLIDYEYVIKLSQLRAIADAFDRESKGAIAYLYELIDLVPEEIADKATLSSAYSRLMLAEDTYHTMSEEDKGDVSEEKYNQLITKHAKISTQIQLLYVMPFTSKVLRCSAVNSTDSYENAEAKRVIIYDLMNEYHSFPTFVKEYIPASTVSKLNALYESASIKVTKTVNNLPVDMNGDFDEETDLVLTEPKLDDNAVSDATGKAVYQAIDVKMYSGEQEVQPTSKIRIKMEISKELSDADVSVVYINDEGIVYDVQGEVIEENEKHYITFFTDHFSSFAVLYNQSAAEEISIGVDNEYPEIGDYITATASGTVNSSNCIMLLTGYSATGEVTFVKTGTTSASATVEEKTETIKAMLWDKALMPIAELKKLTVTE